MSDANLDRIVKELVATHGCHTVVLYGSRARGEGSDASDYDVVGIRAQGTPNDEPIHDAREVGGLSLDAFVISEARALTAEPGAIRYRHGAVLISHEGWGEKLIEHATALFRAGPRALAPHERASIGAWVAKMLARVARGGGDDVEANYRKAWLLYELLEVYFKLRGRWYLGPKESFSWLRGNDPAAYALFDQALMPEASRGALRRLAERVLDPLSP